MWREDYAPWASSRPSGSARLAVSQPKAADGMGFDLELEAGDERPRLGDGRLDFRKLQRGLVAFGISPHFGHPDRIGISRIGGDDIAEATRQGAGAGAQHIHDSTALAACRP